MNTFFINYYISKKMILKLEYELEMLEDRTKFYYDFPNIDRFVLNTRLDDLLSELSNLINNVKQFYLTYELETNEQQEKYIDNCIDIYSITKEKLYKKTKPVDNTIDIYLNEISEYMKILKKYNRIGNLKDAISIIRYIIFNLDCLNKELDMTFETMNLKYKNIETNNKKLEKKLKYLTGK